MDKMLYLMRGVPGSGKSTLARKLAPNAHFEADDYFMRNGKYMYDVNKIYNAHKFCQKETEIAMLKDIPVIAVANTFIKKKNMLSYYKLAEMYGYKVVEKICTGNYQNVHNVPCETIEKMRKEFEY